MQNYLHGQLNRKKKKKRENSFNKNDIHKQKSCTWLIAIAAIALLIAVNTHFHQEKTAWMVQQQQEHNLFIFYFS